MEADIGDARALGLLMDCPITRDNPAVCPFEELRRLPIAERLQWYRALTVSERHNLVEICSVCPDAERRVRISAGR